MRVTIQTRLLTVFLILAVISPLAAKGPRYPRINVGEEVSGILHTDREDGWYRTYVFDIPVTAVAFRLRLIDSGADLDLFLKHGEDMEDHSSADFYSETEDWQEELHVYKAYETDVPAGRYYLDVVYQLDEVPRKEGLLSPSIPYSLVLEVFDGQDTIALIPDEVTHGLLDESGGYMVLYDVEVPVGIDSFRFDVLECKGDVDLFLSRNNPAPARNEFYFISESMAGRESVLITGDGEDLSGQWYLTVLEAVELEHHVPFTIVFTTGSEVPDAAPAPPDISRSSDPMAAGRLATVQLIGGGGIGSGCLVGSEGYILSNQHVIEDITGLEMTEMLVAVSVDAYQMPIEAFTAEVVSTLPDDDLALLRITGDRWGRPLPEDMVFPGWKIGDSSDIRPGEPLMVLGYPWVGSGLSRPFFTVTRGILSGGEMTPQGLILKTDAVISGGSSGGAVTDGSWKLLGLPTFVVSDSAAQMTFFIPVDRIPRGWRELIRYE